MLVKATRWPFLRKVLRLPPLINSHKKLSPPSEVDAPSSLLICGEAFVVDRDDTSLFFTSLFENASVFFFFFLI